MIIKKKYVIAQGREARIVEIRNRHSYFIYAISSNTNRLLSMRYIDKEEKTEIMLLPNGNSLGMVLYYKGDTVNFKDISNERLIMCDRAVYGEKSVRCITQNLNIILRTILGDKDYNILDIFRVNRSGNHFYLEEADSYTETFKSYLEAFR